MSCHSSRIKYSITWNAQASWNIRDQKILIRLFMYASMRIKTFDWSSVWFSTVAFYKVVTGWLHDLLLTTRYVYPQAYRYARKPNCRTDDHRFGSYLIQPQTYIIKCMKQKQSTQSSAMWLLHTSDIMWDYCKGIILSNGWTNHGINS